MDAAPRVGVVHIMEGTLNGTDAWFHNPTSQVSAHFGIGKDGRCFQWVDTADVAWHAAAANGYSIGVEHEGFTGESLTTAQLDTDTKLLEWLSLNIPLRESTSNGWCGHGQLGAAGGGHPACPGDPIMAQLPGLLLLAAAGPTPLPPEVQDMDNLTYITFLFRFLLYRAPDPAGLATWNDELNAGKSRAEVWALIQNSPEGVAALNAQRKVLGMPPVKAP